MRRRRVTGGEAAPYEHAHLWRALVARCPTISASAAFVGGALGRAGDSARAWAASPRAAVAAHRTPATAAAGRHAPADAQPAAARRPPATPALHPASRFA